jgi:ubiquinone/menaquinone biosynthesis C-methylase UbiE
MIYQRLNHLHPIEKAEALESKLRYWLQNPRKILEKYIHSGMTALDLGCGTGYFIIEMANLIGKSGQVIATDVQAGMLDILSQKVNSTGHKPNIQIVHNQDTELRVFEKVDFILALYSFHEMKYLDRIIPQLKSIVKPGTKIFIAEQLFHVPKKGFHSMIQKMIDNGFIICERPRVFFSRAVVMQIRD